MFAAIVSAIGSGDLTALGGCMVIGGVSVVYALIRY